MLFWKYSTVTLAVTYILYEGIHGEERQVLVEHFTSFLSSSQGKTTFFWAG